VKGTALPEQLVKKVASENATVEGERLVGVAFIVG
jgi:hypothetical protein